MTSAEIKAEVKSRLAGKWKKAALICLVYFLLMFCVGLVTGFFSDTALAGFIELVLYIIEIPISFGLIVSFMKLIRDEEVSYLGFLQDGFASFGRVWGVVGNTLLKIIVPIIIIVISIVLLALGIFSVGMSAVLEPSSMGGSAVFLILGVIGYIGAIIYLIPKAFSYYLSFFLLKDHPEMSGKQLVEKSAELMYGHRWKLFYLSLSFIGWYLLLGLGTVILTLIFAFMGSAVAAVLSLLAVYIGLLFLMPYMMCSFIVFYENRVKEAEGNITTTSAVSEIPVVEEKKEETDKDDDNPIQEK